MTIKDYIYPPRPENKVPRSSLQSFDNGTTFLSQPKFNGSCGEIYIGNGIKAMNRHKSELTGFIIPHSEIKSIISNNDINLIVGEYMNKSKKDHTNNVFNHKFIIYDIIVFNGEHLLGQTFQQRLNILYDMFKFVDENDYSYKITDNIYMTKTFDTDFCNLWDNLTKIDMIEGLVLKRKNAGLESGVGKQMNNVLSQIKCRKQTKNYSY